jgi:hypothetical protein
VVPRLAPKREERPDRTAEGDEHARRGDPGGDDARNPRPVRAGSGSCRRAAQAGRATLRRSSPRSSESRSTSSESRRRLRATTRPRPTQTSEAAIAITASAKIWPAPLCQCARARSARGCRR